LKNGAIENLHKNPPGSFIPGGLKNQIKVVRRLFPQLAQVLAWDSGQDGLVALDMTTPVSLSHRLPLVLVCNKDAFLT